MWGNYVPVIEILFLGLCQKMSAWGRMKSSKMAATCWLGFGDKSLPCTLLDKLEEMQSARDTG